MYCPVCGHPNPDDAKFCSQCGQKLPHQPLKTPEGEASDYEMVAYDNDVPEALPLSDSGPVHERRTGSLVKGLALWRTNQWRLKLLLLLSLIVVLSLSWLIVKRAEDQKKKQAVGVEQKKQQATKIQKEEERKKKAAYLDGCDEFILLCSAQAGDFEATLAVLKKAESKRWLGRIFLGSIHQKALAAMRHEDSYRSLTDRQKRLNALAPKLSEPPEEFEELLAPLQSLLAKSKGLAAGFQGAIDAETPKHLEEDLADFSLRLGEARTLLDRIRAAYKTVKHPITPIELERWGVFLPKKAWLPKRIGRRQKKIF